MNDSERVALAMECRDSDTIPKVPGAGEIIRSSAGDYQVMHNGVKVSVDGHYGAYNIEVIERLRGHHEPQEERVFHDVMKRIRPGGAMLELGSFWAYYSLWFLNAVPGSRAVMVEPLQSALDAGQRNFSLNGKTGTFVRAAIDESSHAEEQVELWPGMTTHVRRTTVDALLMDHGLGTLDILHSDIQGAEVRMLKGADDSLRHKRIRWIFISTHGENIHQQCLRILRRHDYAIVAQHTPAESFSVDGLIVASSDRTSPRIGVSRRSTSRTLRMKARAAVRVNLLEPLRLKAVTL